MSISRRNFIAGSSAFLALAANAQSFKNTYNNLNYKKGLAGAAPAASNLLTSWYYRWGLKPATGGMPTIAHPEKFFPMIWGWYPKYTIPNLETMQSEHLPILLGFNEPDNKHQSNIPVETAIKAWPYFQGAARELVSPAPANPLGTWMQTFMSAVEKQNLQLNAVAVHSYGGINATAFLNMLHKVHDLYQRPIYVTEFAVADWHANKVRPNRYTVAEVADFMKSVCLEMNRMPWVKGYAWYPWGGGQPLISSKLFNADGTLNDLGQLYGDL